jgi:hypothetical protein
MTCHHPHPLGDHSRPLLALSLPPAMAGLPLSTLCERLDAFVADEDDDDAEMAPVPAQCAGAPAARARDTSAV